MNCHKAQSLMLLYCDDELSQKRKTELETHLSGCSACARQHALLSESYASLEMPDAAMAPHLWPAIVSRLEETPGRRGILAGARAYIHEHYRPALGMACCAVLGILVGFVIVGSPIPTTRTASSIMEQPIENQLYDIHPPLSAHALYASYIDVEKEKP